MFRATKKQADHHLFKISRLIAVFYTGKLGVAWRVKVSGDLSVANDTLETYNERVEGERVC